MSMNITTEDVQYLTAQVGTLTLQVVVLEREKRELTAALAAARERLELLGNPDGLRVSGHIRQGTDP